MALTLGLGEPPIRRRGSGSGIIIVNSHDELALKDRLGFYKLDNDIYFLYYIDEDKKYYVKYDSKGNTSHQIYLNGIGEFLDDIYLTEGDVINDLDSDLITRPLSAAQGKVLYEMLDGKIEVQKIMDITKITEEGLYTNGDDTFYCYGVNSDFIKLLRFSNEKGITNYTYVKSVGNFTEDNFILSQDIVNNLTTPATTVGKALDARQGKILSDKIDSTAFSINNSIYNLDQSKVTKEPGKGLVPVDEIAKLQKLKNYDDSEIKKALENISNTMVVKDGDKQLSEEDFTTELKDRLENLGSIIRVKGMVDSTDYLPLVDNEVGDLYLVGVGDGEVGGNIYEEFLWINTGASYKWELIGTTTNINLSDYYKKEEVNELISKVMPYAPVASLKLARKIGFYNYLNDLYLLYEVSDEFKWFLRCSGKDIEVIQYTIATDTSISMSFLTEGSIKNDLLTDIEESGYALDARQGKILNTKIEDLEFNVISYVKNGWKKY